MIRFVIAVLVCMAASQNEVRAEEPNALLGKIYKMYFKGEFAPATKLAKAVIDADPRAKSTDTAQSFAWIAECHRELALRTKGSKTSRMHLLNAARYNRAAFDIVMWRKAGVSNWDTKKPYKARLESLLKSWYPDSLAK